MLPAASPASSPNSSANASQGPLRRHEILLSTKPCPTPSAPGRSPTSAASLSGGAEGMITMDNSLMARVKDGPSSQEAYMKGPTRPSSPRCKPGDLEAGH